MARKFTRKQLKKPDEFITLSSKVIEWVRTHVIRVSLTVLTAIVVFAGVKAYQYFQEKKARESTRALSRGIDLFDRTVVRPEDKTAAKEDPFDDLPIFTSAKDKLAATDTHLSSVYDQQGTNTSVGRFALLMRASIRYEQARYAESVADYTAYLNKGIFAQPTFRTAALLGLTFAYEAQKDWTNALATLKKLDRNGDKEFRALYHEARILKSSGDTKKATALYQKIVDGAEARLLVEQAGQRLAVLPGAS